MSWILQEQRMQNLNQNIIPENITYLRCGFYYIDLHNSVSKIIYEKIQIQNSCITQETLLQIIQNKRKGYGEPYTKYIWQQSLLFYIHLEHTQIQSFKPENYLSFVKNIFVIQDIVFLSSLFMFHPHHTLYFFFKEQPKTKHKTRKIRILTVPPENATNHAGTQSS